MIYPAKIPHGIMFHYFHNARHYSSPGSLSEEDFERMLHFIGLKRIIEPEEWIEKIKKNRLKKTDVCITFDDTLLCQFEVALPVLSKYQIKAFWFVCSDVLMGHINKLAVYHFFRYNFFNNINDFYNNFFTQVFKSKFYNKVKKIINKYNIQRYLNSYPFYSVNDIKFRLIRDCVLNKQEYEIIMDKIIEEKSIRVNDIAKNLWMSEKHIKYLSAQGHMIGLHSYSHPTNFAELSLKEQWREYSLNYMHIKSICGRPPLAMSHPENSYNAITLKILKRLGIICGFRANMHPPRGKRLNPTQYEISREDQTNIIKMMNKKYENKFS